MLTFLVIPEQCCCDLQDGSAQNKVVPVDVSNEIKLTFL